MLQIQKLKSSERELTRPILPLGMLGSAFRSKHKFADVSRLRGNNLDALRLVLALTVIFVHAFYLTKGYSAKEPTGAFMHGRLEAGGLAVDAFFVISGFLIFSSWERRKSAADYWKRRIGRIYPGLICALLVSAFVVAPLGGARVPAWLRSQNTYAWIFRPLFLRQVSTIEGAFPNDVLPGNVNGSIWTIRYEIFCYLLVALMGLCHLLHRHLVLVSFVVCVAFARSNPFVIKVPFFDDLNQMPRLISFFLAGMLIYAYRRSIPYSGWIALAAAAVLILSRGRSIAVLWPIVFPYFVLFIGFWPALRLQNFLGGVDLSYGVYLYGFPIQRLLIYYYPMQTPMMNFSLAACSSCVVGYLSWIWIERPVLNRVRSKSRCPARLEADAMASSSREISNSQSPQTP